MLNTAFNAKKDKKKENGWGEQTWPQRIVTLPVDTSFLIFN